MTQSTNEKLGQATQGAKEVASHARAIADEGVKKLAGLTHDHRDTIDAKLDQASQFAASKLGTQHASKIEKVKELIGKGLDKLAQQRPAGRAAQDLKESAEHLGDAAKNAGEAVKDTAQHAADAAQDAAEQN